MARFRGTVRASSIFVSADRIIPEGGLVTEGGRVARVLERGEAGPEPVLEFPDSVILPGLVNAHTHLELSRIGRSERAALRAEQPFVDWLFEVVRKRGETGREGLRDAAREGLDDALAFGTTALVDFSNGGHSAEFGHPVRRAVLWEMLGFEPESGRAAFTEAQRWVEAAGGTDIVRGYAPHAPYSIDAEAIRSAAEAARAREAPWSIHVAEHPGEAEFLARGTGPLRDLLERIGRSLDRWTPPKATPTEYLDRLGVLGPGALIVHGNYLGGEDIARLARSGATVIYCPRTHTRFGHPAHPIERLIDAGVNVALGTDSLASTDDLSILAEIAEAARKHPGISPREWLRLATASPHRALNNRWGTGTLEPGQPADLTVFEIEGKSPDRAQSQDSDDPEAPLRSLLQAPGPPPRAKAVLIQGEWARIEPPAPEPASSSD